MIASLRKSMVWYCAERSDHRLSGPKAWSRRPSFYIPRRNVYNCKRISTFNGDLTGFWAEHICVNRVRLFAFTVNFFGPAASRSAALTRDRSQISVADPVADINILK